jgi:hypothetical protein
LNINFCLIFKLYYSDSSDTLSKIFENKNIKKIKKEGINIELNIELNYKVVCCDICRTYDYGDLRFRDWVAKHNRTPLR